MRNHAPEFYGRTCAWSIQGMMQKCDCEANFASIDLGMCPQHGHVPLLVSVSSARHICRRLLASAGFGHVHATRLAGYLRIFKKHIFLPQSSCFFPEISHPPRTVKTCFVLQNAIAFSQISSLSGNRTSERAWGLFGPSDRGGKVAATSIMNE